MRVPRGERARGPRQMRRLLVVRTGSETAVGRMPADCSIRREAAASIWAPACRLAAVRRARPPPVGGASKQWRVAHGGAPRRR
jgi:hypothetical protein